MRSAFAALALLVVGFGGGFEAATHWDALESHWRAILSALPLSSSPHSPAAYENYTISLSGSSDEVRDHLLGPHLSIRTSDKSVETFGNDVRLNLIVSPSGSVVSAVPRREPKAFLFSGKGKTAVPNGPAKFFSEAVRLARQWKFIPFERAGTPTFVRIDDIGMPIYPSERRPDYRSPFPAIENWNSIRITLARTSCYGACPSYTIEIHGDGSVEYVGTSDVALSGLHHARIARSTIAHLVNHLRKADYFSLLDGYTASVTDNPTFTTSISFDGRSKKVIDYVGLEDGMPDAVSDVEDAIDTAVDSNRWLKGDAETAASLVAEGWNFHSNDYDNLSMTAGVAELGSSRALSELVAGGAPIGPVPPRRANYGIAVTASALENAASRGNEEMVQVLLGAGAGKDKPTVKRALVAAARVGNLNVVQILAYQLDGNPQIEPIEGALSAAAGSCNPEVVSWILKSNHIAHETGETGNNPLFAATGNSCNDDNAPGSSVRCDETVKVLIKAGARVDARDKDDNTALMESNFKPRVTKVLIAAGADVNAQNHDGRTALMESGEPAVSSALLEAGANPYLRDRDGRTALELEKNGHIFDSEEVTKVVTTWMTKHPEAEYRRAE